MAPRILQETQEILQSFYFINQEKDLPNGIKNHERKWERMRGRWERFCHNRVAMRIDVQMRRGRLYFI
jgi:hypothetical protein